MVRYAAAMTKYAPLIESRETESVRRRRIAREAERIAEADASVAAGRLVDESEVDAWIDSIGTGRELPVPRSGR